MLINDILIGFVLSFGFPIGHILFLWSKEEVDWVLDKYKFLNNLEKIILPFAIVTGILGAVFIKNLEIILILFFVNLLLASATIKEKKQILLPMVLFLVGFFTLYFIKNSLRLL